MANKEDLKRYELMLIVDPDLGENGIKKELEKVRGQIEAAKGEVFHEDLWGVRHLAYKIKKRDHGYFAVLDFTIDPTALKEMDRFLRLENELLRHGLLVLPKAYEPIAYNGEFKPFEIEPELMGDKKEKKDRKPREEMERPAREAVKVEPKAAPHKAAEPKADTAKAPKKKSSMEDIDAKLSSIIENPDINL